MEPTNENESFVVFDPAAFKRQHPLITKQQFRLTDDALKIKAIEASSLRS